MQLKCYSQENKLHKTKQLELFSNQFYDALFEAQCILRAECIYIKNKNSSTKIHTQIQKITVQSPYIGFDGIETWTIPIRPTSYPFTVKK